jgi:hypothetical protein
MNDQSITAEITHSELVNLLKGQVNAAGEMLARVLALVENGRLTEASKELNRDLLQRVHRNLEAGVKYEG